MKKIDYNTKEIAKEVIKNTKDIGYKGIKKIKEHKKKIIKALSLALGIILIGGGSIGGFLIYRMKSNIAYTQQQLEEIALNKISGEIVKVEKDFNLEDGDIEFEFQIKDKENMIREIELSARTGGILKIKDRTHNKYKYKYNHREKNNLKSNNENIVNKNQNNSSLS
ncbi:PepSY domain-containing protein [Clostridium fallax]|uniref:Peptidase propeptide and YPEB domain-containing protein n=1 Tax=Clostridium fallax TaxID=1533 RepID=A0A1M4Z6X3_9CLOT|nr:hypothetical protein [Clostridium fallax]SHF13698.1 hypothetical protein SAMN05443638_1388 [Clostridium fallax]SQB05877.1 Uncharacterised protein [Clostridium fallax]